MTLVFPREVDWPAAAEVIEGVDEETGLCDLAFEFGELVASADDVDGHRQVLRMDLHVLQRLIASSVGESHGPLQRRLKLEGTENPDASAVQWNQAYWRAERLAAIGALEAAGIAISRR